MTVWQTARYAVDLSHPRVMGIVNTTPDSFSDGGRHADVNSALSCCERLLNEGADILDIGGESTRPGAQMPTWQEERSRVLPVVQEAVKLGVPVSVDTSRPEIIDAVLDAGADIINDVRALRWPGALEAVLRHPGTGVCLMHMQGEPATMQQAPHYADVLAEVMAELAAHVQRVTAAGLAPDCVVLDPGYGFGKTLDHNLSLFRQQAALCGLGRPVLVGWSRKGTLGQLTGRAVADRLVPSVAAALAAVSLGARIVRVHDVAATVDALKIWAAAGLDQYVLRQQQR